jgi:hypothetical protein
VTSEDCIASIKRWAAKDSMGQKLMDLRRTITAVDAKTFTDEAEGARPAWCSSASASRRRMSPS